MLIIGVYCLCSFVFAWYIAERKVLSRCYRKIVLSVQLFFFDAMV